MKKFKRPPAISQEQFKSINAYLLSSVSLYRYAIFFELSAYPGMISERLRESELRNVDIESKTILKIPILEMTVGRLVKHLVRYGIKKPGDRLFDFSRVRAYYVWKRALKETEISQKAQVKDYKEAFNTYLRQHYPDFEGRISFGG